MKKTVITIGLTLAFIASVLAVPLCVEVPANDVPRVQEAFGSILGLGRPANIAEVQHATRAWLIGQTQDYERRKNMATFTPPPLEMQPTPTPTPARLAASPAPAAVAQPTPTPKKK